MRATIKLTPRFFSILLMGILTMACSKDGDVGPMGLQGQQGIQGLEGPQGPAGQDGEAQGVPGPQGEQGEPGVAGQDGTDGIDGQDGMDGEDGDPGTANVIYSEWFDTQFGDDINAQTSSFMIDFPEGSTTIMDSGSIFVFARRIFLEGNTGDLIYLFYQLPVSFNGTGHYYSFSVRNGNEIRITVQTFDGTSIGDATNIQQYRYVVIPGGVASSGKSIPEDYTKMSYEEIAERFNIPD